VVVQVLSDDAIVKAKEDVLLLDSGGPWNKNLHQDVEWGPNDIDPLLHGVYMFNMVMDLHLLRFSVMTPVKAVVVKCMRRADQKKIHWRLHLRHATGVEKLEHWYSDGDMQIIEMANLQASVDNNENIPFWKTFQGVLSAVAVPASGAPAP